MEPNLLTKISAAASGGEEGKSARRSQELPLCKVLLKKHRQHGTNSIQEETHPSRVPFVRMNPRSFHDDQDMTKSERLVMILSNALEVKGEASVQQSAVAEERLCSAAPPSVPPQIRSANTFANSSVTNTSDSRGAEDSVTLPVKLYSVLSCPDLSRIVAWQPHGRAWKILDLDAFCLHVLPIFLNGSSIQEFNSFVRTLNLWGFRQFTRLGPDTSAFYHETFLRGHPSLLRTMKPSQPNLKRPLHDPFSEPDLYSLPSLPEDPQDRLSLAALQHLKSRRSQPQQTPAQLDILRGMQNKVITSRASSATPAAGLQMSRRASGMSAGTPSFAEGCTDAVLYQLANEVIAKQKQQVRVTNQLTPTALACSQALRENQSANHTAYTPKTTAPVREVSAEEVSDSSKNSQPKKKKRKKWLPPLGPASSASKSSPTSGSTSSAEWFYTNPEVFASLSN